VPSAREASSLAINEAASPWAPLSTLYAVRYDHSKDSKKSSLTIHAARVQVVPIPGLRRLKVLHLERCAVRVELARLLEGCPLLRSLTIRDCHTLSQYVRATPRPRRC
jgi:hypothetical protein